MKEEEEIVEYFPLILPDVVDTFVYSTLDKILNVVLFIPYNKEDMFWRVFKSCLFKNVLRKYFFSFLWLHFFLSLSGVVFI